MSRSEKKILDFSHGRFREMLVWQRKNMWTDEAVERHAAWIGFEPGMTIIDVGCGLGYVGYTYWKFFGKGGHYVGVDIRPALLRDAREAAGDWAAGGRAVFTVGDVYKLPLADCSADRVVCQTLMIHLEKPKAALAEMIRVLKPGGWIICIEPDNLRPVLTRPHSSLPEYDIETLLLIHKVGLIANLGRIRTGRGDKGIAPKIPHMLNELAIEDIDMRVKDTVPFLEPPYPTEQQQRTIENMKKYMLSDESYQANVEEQREEFLAGGGDEADFNRLFEIGREQCKIQLQQIENKEFYICGAYPIYLIKGRKRN